MRRGVRSWECAGALMAAPPLLLSCRSTFRWQTGRQPPAWKRRRRYRGEGGLSWQGQGAGCQCWVRAPQQPRAAAGLGRTLGYGVRDGGIGPLPLPETFLFPLLSQADLLQGKAEEGAVVQVPGSPPPPPRPHALGTPVAQAKPGTGRGGVQGRWPGAGVQMADGRWDMGSWGSAMCGGVYVCDRESDGSPFLQAAEAPGTDGGASRDSAQSSAQTASSKELLQRMVGVEGLPVRGGWGCRP